MRSHSCRNTFWNGPRNGCRRALWVCYILGLTWSKMLLDHIVVPCRAPSGPNLQKLSPNLSIPLRPFPTLSPPQNTDTTNTHDTHSTQINQPLDVRTKDSLSHRNIFGLWDFLWWFFSFFVFFLWDPDELGPHFDLKSSTNSTFEHKKGDWVGRVSIDKAKCYVPTDYDVFFSFFL